MYIRHIHLSMYHIYSLYFMCTSYIHTPHTYTSPYPVYPIDTGKLIIGISYTSLHPVAGIVELHTVRGICSRALLTPLQSWASCCHEAAVSASDAPSWSWKPAGQQSGREQEPRVGGTGRRLSPRAPVGPHKGGLTLVTIAALTLAMGASCRTRGPSSGSWQPPTPDLWLGEAAGGAGESGGRADPAAASHQHGESQDQRQWGWPAKWQLLPSHPPDPSPRPKDDLLCGDSHRKGISGRCHWAKSRWHMTKPRLPSPISLSSRSIR